MGQREADAASATRLETCDHGQGELAIPCAVVYVKKKNYLTHLSVEVSLVCETSIVHTQFFYNRLIFGGNIMIEKNVQVIFTGNSLRILSNDSSSVVIKIFHGFSCVSLFK